MEPPSKGQFSAGIPTQQIRGGDPAAAAAANLGRAVKQTGDIALQLKEEQERQYMTDAEIIMRKESAKLAGDLALNQDPSKHYELAKERLDGVKASILGHEGFSGRFTKKIGERIDLFTSAKLEKIGTDAKIMQVENGRRLHKAKIDGLMADGQYEAASQAYDDGVGTYYPKEAAELGKLRVARQQRNEGWKAQVMAGNEDFFKNEDLPMSDSDRARYQKAARIAQSQKENDDLNKIQAAMETGEISTQEELGQALEAASNITPEKAKAMAKNWESTRPITRDERFSFTERVRKLEIAAGEMDADDYTEAYLELRSDAIALGRRTNADYIRGIVEGANPERLQANKAKGDRLRLDWEKAQVDEKMKVSLAHWDDHSDKAFKAITKETGEKFPAKSAGLLFDQRMRDYYKRTPGATRQEAEQEAFRVTEDIYIDYVKDGFIGSAPKKGLSGELPPVSINSGSSKKRSDIPYNGTPANVRYNNPGAAYPRQADEKYGLIGYGRLQGGKQGSHKIGRFPTPIHGAAANLDLFASSYTGKTVYAAVRKWRGNGGRGEKTVVPKGYDPQMTITPEFLNDPGRAVDFFKKMALHESPNFGGMSDDDWRKAWEMWKERSA